jgi:hypothetical protein
MPAFSYKATQSRAEGGGNMMRIAHLTGTTGGEKAGLGRMAALLPFGRAPLRPVRPPGPFLKSVCWPDVVLVSDLRLHNRETIVSNYNKGDLSADCDDDLPG